MKKEKKIYQGPLVYDLEKKKYSVNGRLIKPDDKLRIFLRIEDDDEGEPDYMAYDVELVLIEDMWNVKNYSRQGDKFSHDLKGQLAGFLGIQFRIL